MAEDHSKGPVVAVIGLGYVGLTLGVALAQRGVQVYGVERRQDVVDLTNKGVPHFSEVGLDVALSAVVSKGLFVSSQSTEQVPPADYYIITVGTPLKPGTHEPRLDMIEDATREVATHMRDGATVVLRSTVRVGTTRGVVEPILLETGKRIHLSMCPERTLEGDALRELSVLPQIVGGTDAEATDHAAMLFSRLTSTIVRVEDPETAEMIKLVDNTSRDVRFAFANEVARACDAVGINAHDVIKFGKLGYPRTNVALPGLVGGPCLEKDPHILVASVAQYGVTLEITSAARLVNERQPQETTAAVMRMVQERRDGPYVVTVAGMAFKGRPETDDLRGSVSLDVVAELRNGGLCSEIRAFDRVVSAGELVDLPYDVRVFEDFYDACDGADLVIIANNHPMFATIDLARAIGLMRPGGIVYDYWNNLAEQPQAVLAGRYFAVGNLAGVH